MNSVLELFEKVINTFVPKKNAIYAKCMSNSKHDKYDILNCNSSNLFRVLNRYSLVRHTKKVTIYTEISDNTRKLEYDKFEKMTRQFNVKLVFLETPQRDTVIIRRLFQTVRNAICRYSCKLWLSETGDSYFYGKTKSQKIVCMNYFVPCKNDYVPDRDMRWRYLDALLTSSLLPSQIISATEGVQLKSCKMIGFPRNDVFTNNEKDKEVLEWIEKRIGYKPKHIVVYAPTFRDYENGKEEGRLLFGYSCERIEEYMKEMESVLVYKLHPLQNTDAVLNPNVFIEYEASYDFSFYDLLNVSSCLIGDYSSVNFDYLLCDKPLVFNLYDYNKYSQIRGVSYEPYSFFCPGEIVSNEEELLNALRVILSGKDAFSQRRSDIRRIIFRNTDGKATQRAIDMIDELL